MAIGRTNMRDRSLSGGIQYRVLKWWTVICVGGGGKMQGNFKLIIL